MTEVLATVVRIDGSVRVATVESRSELGKTHKVIAHCPCRSFRYRGYCRHLFEAAHQFVANPYPR